jgi:hypothetical protein
MMMMMMMMVMIKKITQTTSSTFSIFVFLKMFVFVVDLTTFFSNRPEQAFKEGFY